MNNALKFIFFIIYSTAIFFLPNNFLIFIPVIINIVFLIIMHKHFKSIIKITTKILPFIIFTFAINCWLDTVQNAIWIGIKLLIVCNITVIYSKTTSSAKIADTISTLLAPLKVFGIKKDDIRVLISITLSMIPILKKDFKETKEACKAKGIPVNIRNMKYIISSFFITLLKRVNQIEDSLVAKGYE